MSLHAGALSPQREQTRVDNTTHQQARRRTAISPPPSQTAPVGSLSLGRRRGSAHAVAIAQSFFSVTHAGSAEEVDPADEDIQGEFNYNSIPASWIANLPHAGAPNPLSKAAVLARHAVAGTAAPGTTRPSSRRVLSDDGDSYDSDPSADSVASHLDQDGRRCDCGGLVLGHGPLYPGNTSDVGGDRPEYYHDDDAKSVWDSELGEEAEQLAHGDMDECGCGGLLHRRCGMIALKKLETQRRAAADPDVAIDVHEVKEVPRQLPLRAGQELAHGPIVKTLARFFPGILAFLIGIYLASSVFSLVYTAVVLSAPTAVTVFLAIMTAAFTLISLPFWIMLTQWHPCTPHKVQMYPKRSIDIVLTIYKEDIDIIVGTLAAIQRIEYDPDFLRVYVLDDGKRNEIEQIINGMNLSSKIRYPICYVTRPNNKGRKGGNINHWVRKYDHIASEFFVVLDADMQPFPDLCDIFFGHYYGFDEETRLRIAYIQAPQHFSNFRYRVWQDPFETGLTFFYKVILPCMDRAGCVMYIGTCGLWRRSALKLGGGFQEQHATEDSVTGCEVHRTKVTDEVEEEKMWISKYVMQPVAVGISPATLPDLMDQRLRWVVGSVEMCSHHDFFFFARELGFVQSAAYFITSAYWGTGMFCYVMVFIETIGIYIVLLLEDRGPGAQAGFPPYIIIVPLLGFWVYWMLLPVCKGVEKIRSVQMYFCYVPVFFAAYLKHLGFKIKVQATAADNDTPACRWHPLFWIPVITMALVTVGGIVTAVLMRKSITNFILVAWHVLLWAFFFWPIGRAMGGYANIENDIYVQHGTPGIGMDEYVPHDMKLRSDSGLTEVTATTATSSGQLLSQPLDKRDASVRI